MKTPIITLPAFGAYIAGQGGHFAGILRGPTVNGAQKSAEALLVCASEHEDTLAWGEYGKTVDGCDSRTDGYANTLAMLAANCQAAMHARGLIIDGHSDFYLPAIGELNTAAANVPELFDPKGIFWASTQDDRYDAFVQYFENGYSDWASKGYEFRVRPVRRIPLHLLSA